MKKTSLIINIVLAVAVVVLFILHFASKPATTTTLTHDGETKAIANEATSIAWVNMDSVLANYDMYFDIQKELEEKGRKMERDMNTRTRSLEKEMIDFQDKVQKGLVTRSTAQQMQQDLALKEQELYVYRDELRMQFAEEEQVMLRRIQHGITDFVNQYNQDKGYEIILSGAFGGPLLYGHPSIDITADVLSGLNKEYQKSKPTKK